MNDIKNFVKLSKYAGERFDLVQAGGGNSSVKQDNGTMYVKASGFILSEVETDSGYVSVKNKEIIAILENKELLLKDKNERNKLVSKLLSKATLDKKNRPSIETFLHALLYKYTLHIHPLIVSSVVCRKDWREVLGTLFTGDAAFVDYRTPGIDFAIELKKIINEYQVSNREKPKIIFMQNHGLIVSAQSCEEVIEIIENILDKLEEYLNVDLKKYRMTNMISNLANSIGDTFSISYLSSDAEINRFIKNKQELFSKAPFCPDGLVYCGKCPLVISDLTDLNTFIEYKKKYSEQPKIVIFNNHVFIRARNIRKAKEIEDVLKYHILTLDIAQDKINYLTDGELSYLSNWEAEKYRRKL